MNDFALPLTSIGAWRSVLVVIGGWSGVRSTPVIVVWRERYGVASHTHCDFRWGSTFCVHFFYVAKHSSRAHYAINQSLYVRKIPFTDLVKHN